MDFRAYVQQQAPALYNYVGNDGGVDAPKIQTQLNSGMGSVAGASLYGYNSVDQVRGTVSGLYNTYNQQNAAPSGGAISTSKVDPNFVNQAYDTKIAGLQSQLDTLNPQQQNATLNVQNQFQNQSNALQGQQAQGHRNLDMASQQVEDSKAKSLNDLRNQVQTMGMSYNNQLGAYGAGDSSAAGLIQQALSGQASKNRAGVMDSAAQQGQAITLQGQDLDTEFQNNLKSLDDWKSSSLNDIATKFLTQKQAIQQAMVGANADRYQALAQADASYTNQAIQQLANLENTYKQQATDLNSQYQQAQAPAAAINSNLLQYAVNPISAGQIGSLGSIPQRASQYSTDPSAVVGPRKFDDAYGLSLQPGY
jgi:hypothetical protein